MDTAKRPDSGFLDLCALALFTPRRSLLLLGLASLEDTDASAGEGPAAEAEVEREVGLSAACRGWDVQRDQLPFVAGRPVVTEVDREQIDRVLGAGNDAEHLPEDHSLRPVHEQAIDPDLDLDALARSELDGVEGIEPRALRSRPELNAAIETGWRGDELGQINVMFGSESAPFAITACRRNTSLPGAARALPVAARTTIANAQTNDTIGCFTRLTSGLGRLTSNRWENGRRR